MGCNPGSTLLVGLVGVVWSQVSLTVQYAEDHKLLQASCPHAGPFTVVGSCVQQACCIDHEFPHDIAGLCGWSLSPEAWHFLPRSFRLGSASQLLALRRACLILPVKGPHCMPIGIALFCVLRLFLYPTSTGLVMNDGPFGWPHFGWLQMTV